MQSSIGELIYINDMKNTLNYAIILLLTIISDKKLNS